MNLFLKIIAIVMVANVPVMAQDVTSAKSAGLSDVPDTLMFTIDELNEIQSSVAAGQRGGNQAEGNGDAIENATLYLSTIVYTGPDQWTVWINGVPIGPRQDLQAFQVTHIDSQSVELLVPLSALGMKPVRLSPNQTFVAKSGAVVEGRVN